VENLRRQALALLVYVLDIAGVVAAIAAGWMVWPPVGVAILAVSCLVIAWLIDQKGAA
jgi:hypothetical protein